MPRLARHTDKLAIIRSMHHRSSAHGKGMYWNMTGHPPLAAEVAVNQPPSRQDWPCLGAMVAQLPPRPAPASRAPCSCRIRWSTTTRCKPARTPASSAGGTTRSSCGPIAAGPGAASRATSAPWSCSRADGVDRARASPPARTSPQRRSISGFAAGGGRSYDHFRQMASDMLAQPDACRPPSTSTASRCDLRERYGDHLCGQSVLLARRLTEAGVPIVTVICAAGDLNGSAGDHWDTHGNNFNRLQARPAAAVRPRRQRAARTTCTTAAGSTRRWSSC